MVLGSEYTPRYTFWLGSKPDQVYSVSIRQVWSINLLHVYA